MHISTVLWSVKSSPWSLVNSSQTLCNVEVTGQQEETGMIHMVLD